MRLEGNPPSEIDALFEGEWHSLRMVLNRGDGWRPSGVAECRGQGSRLLPLRVLWRVMEWGLSGRSPAGSYNQCSIQIIYLGEGE